MALVMMRKLETVVSFGFDQNFSKKKERLKELIRHNKKDPDDLNVHSTLKMDNYSVNTPHGEISLANGFKRCIQMFNKCPLYAKKEVVSKGLCFDWVFGHK